MVMAVGSGSILSRPGGIIPVAVRVAMSSMSTMSAVHEMHQRTRQQKQVRQITEHVGAMFTEQEEGCDGDEAKPDQLIATHGVAPSAGGVQMRPFDPNGIDAIRALDGKMNATWSVLVELKTIPIRENACHRHRKPCSAFGTGKFTPLASMFGLMADHLDAHAV